MFNIGDKVIFKDDIGKGIVPIYTVENIECHEYDGIVEHYVDLEEIPEWSFIGEEMILYYEYRRQIIQHLKNKSCLK